MFVFEDCSYFSWLFIILLFICKGVAAIPLHAWLIYGAFYVCIIIIIIIITTFVYVTA